MTRLTLQQGDGSHCLARRRRPDAGADEEDVKPRPPQHAAPAPPVKPKPPPHPQTAPFRATLPRHGRSRLHRGANCPRHGRARLHHGASDLTQGRPRETQTTLACRTSAPSETPTTPASTNCPISSHTTEARAGPVASPGEGQAQGQPEGVGRHTQLTATPAVPAEPAAGSVGGVSIGVDDGRSPLPHEDLGAGGDLHRLSAGQGGDPPIWGADLCAIRRERVLNPRAVCGGANAHVRARQGHRRVGHHN